MKHIGTFVVALALLTITTAAFAAEWTGTIEKKNGKSWLKSGANTLSITNPEKATGFEGKTVKVTGSADMTGKTVRIDSVSAAH